MLRLFGLLGIMVLVNLDYLSIWYLMICSALSLLENCCLLDYCLHFDILEDLSHLGHYFRALFEEVWDERTWIKLGPL